MTMSLAARLATIIVVIVALVIGGAVVLSQIMWRQMLYHETYASSGAVAADIRQVIEANLDLGIPLPTLTNTQRLIERATRVSQDLEFIAVTDAAGVILFDTEPGSIGASAPPAWSQPRPDALAWRAAGPDSLLVGNLIRDAYQRPIGSVIVQARTAATDSRLSTSLLAITRNGILLLLGSTVLAIAAAGWLTLELRRWSRRLCADIDAGALPMLQAAGTALARAEQELMRMGTANDSGA